MKSQVKSLKSQRHDFDFFENPKIDKVKKSGHCVTEINTRLNYLHT
jgi:hypothetical protein